MFLHFRSAVADYLSSGSPICSFGVTLAPKVLWGYKRQFAVCKSALCVLVPAICLSFENNFRSAVGKSSTSQQTYRYGVWKSPVYVVQVSTYRKSTKVIAFISQYHYHTESPARCFYIPVNLFFGHSSFWRLSFYCLNCCPISQLIANYTKSVPIALCPDFKPFWHTKSSCALPVDKWYLSALYWS